MPKKISSLILSFIVFPLFTQTAFSFDLKGTYNDTGSNYSPITKNQKISQTFVASHDQLYSITIMLKKSQDQTTNKAKVTLLQDKQIISTKTITPNPNQQEQFYQFSFDPILHSQGQTFTIIIESLQDNSQPSLQVKHSHYNTLARGNLTIGPKNSDTDMVFRTYYHTKGNYFQQFLQSFFQKITSDKTFSTLYILTVFCLVTLLLKTKNLKKR